VNNQAIKPKEKQINWNLPQRLPQMDIQVSILVFFKAENEHSKINMNAETSLSWKIELYT